jgi:hypothetical protein
MLKQLTVFFVALALAVVFVSSVEGEIDYSFSSPCTFTGSWYFEGTSVDTENDISQFGAGSLRLYQSNGNCYANFQLVTPWVDICDRSVLASKGSNWLDFSDFEYPVNIYVYLIGDYNIGVQASFDCIDGDFFGASVRGVRPSKILNVCSSPSYNYFYCDNYGERRMTLNATKAE